MRTRLTFAFLLMGLGFTILQTLMVRELLVAFSGNELALGWVLGFWLVLEALGSGPGGRLLRRVPARPATYAALQALLAVLSLPSLLAALHIRSLVGAVPGEVVAPLPALLSTALVLAPLGLVDGAMFATACRVALRLRAEEADVASTGRVYVLEAVGGIVGGVVLTYLFLPLLTSTQILLLLAALNLASAATLLPGRRPAWPALAGGLLALALLLPALSPYGKSLHRRLVADRWAPYHLAYEGNSNYGNVALIEEAGQVTLFADGAPVLTAPDPDVAAVEHLTHLPTLFLDRPPRRVLVLGGGAGGVLGELLRYPLERLDYAEPDPLLIQALHTVPTALTERELGDPRVRLALEDGRLFVRRQVQACEQGGDCPRYDLVVLNLPRPTTLVWNRFYTAEFFTLLRRVVTERGVVVLPGPPARTYMSAGARDLLRTYEGALAGSFAHLRAIPADGLTLWLASPENPLNLGPADLSRRAAQGPETRFLQPDYFAYLLDAQVAAGFAAGLESGPAVPVNRDGHPSGLRYALAYQSDLLAPGWAAFFRALGRLRLVHGAVAVALLTLAGLVLLRRRRSVLPAIIWSSGVAGMTTDLLLILAYQVLYGHLYRQVGLLITAFMAGLSVGGMGMSRWVARVRRPWGLLLGFEGGLMLAGAGVAGGLAWLLGRPTPLSPLPYLLLLAMNAVVGGLVGLEFPLANQILVQEGVETARAAGVLYAVDLLGATLGAVGLSLVLLPALGVVETLLLGVFLKGGSFLLAAWVGKDRP